MHTHVHTHTHRHTYTYTHTHTQTPTHTQTLTHVTRLLCCLQWIVLLIIIKMKAWDVWALIRAALLWMEVWSQTDQYSCSIDHLVAVSHGALSACVLQPLRMQPTTPAPCSATRSVDRCAGRALALSWRRWHEIRGAPPPPRCRGSDDTLQRAGAAAAVWGCRDLWSPTSRKQRALRETLELRQEDLSLH